MTCHDSITRLEAEIARTRRMTVDAMVEELDIITTRRTYLYLDLDGQLTAIEKPHSDTTPADEAYSIGYVRILRGAFF